MSEFGRTARENGNRGTDHGHANVMFVLGGPVKGGKVYGRWPGLDHSQLYEGRDLASDHGLPPGNRRSSGAAHGEQESGECVSGLRQSAREISEIAGVGPVPIIPGR
jgi:hypothetical protein